MLVLHWSGVTTVSTVAPCYTVLVLFSCITVFILTTLFLRDSAPKQWKTRNAAAPACQGYCRPTRLNQADFDVTATPCINRQKYLWQMSEYERLCYAQTARTEKRQAIYFMLRPKYFASGLNPAIFRKQHATQNSTRNTIHRIKEGEWWVLLKAWLPPAESHYPHIVLFLNRIIPSIIMFRS